LDQLVDGYGLRERMDELDITTGWDQTVGPMIARHTKRVRLRKGRLSVKVDSAPLRHELGFMREALIEVLNRRAGKRVVEEIVVE
jgi:predicted nucleic acid-binding Zn ribbon protein